MKAEMIFTHPKKLATFIKVLLILFPLASFSQQAEIKGRVTDGMDGGPLSGVNILVDSTGAGSTDYDGNYMIRVSPGKHRVSFRFIGYQPSILNIEPKAGEVMVHDIRLQSSMVELNTAVISASKYEQRLSDVTVSMEVIKPDFIEKQNTQQLDDALRLIPGVDVLDGQASIRGGSGYSYGAGSRVLLLVDDLPMLTGDVNDVKWNYIPVELIGQVEVIKGASSALYGSSALNGVINVRTATPGDLPETTVNVSAGLYTKPQRDELSWWWDGVPFFGGIKVSHLRKAGPFDITLGINGFADEGYRTDNYMRYGRFTGGLRFNSPKVKGLSVGFHTSIQYQDISDFLLWTDADSGALVQNPVSVSQTDGVRFNIDPYVTYFDEKQGKHSLLTRYFKVTNNFPDDPDKENGSDYFYGEYQYQRQFRNKLHWIIGTAASYTEGRSQLYGDHTGSTMALFTQFDHRFFEKLSVSLGLRWEGYRMDQTEDESRPVLRAGLNYQAAKSTFIRASFGQGYRFPSMAEKYTATSLGSLNVFPNPELTSESGWSAEVGVSRGFNIGSWSNFIDLAGFWTEYEDMMEFTFGVYLPDSNSVPTLDNLGFKSINIGAARITGIDLSINGNGKIGTTVLNYYAGYTYINPIDLSSDTLDDQILKYRYRHSVKGDVEVIVKKFNTGITLVYQSFMERIDPAFEEMILGQEILPGLKEYRAENDHGAVIFDFRFGWQVTPSSAISLIAKNIFNQEYMGRPGDIQPPRNISLQYIFKIR
jgi:iron complex outermembrane receptor protein